MKANDLTLGHASFHPYDTAIKNIETIISYLNKKKEVPEMINVTKKSHLMVDLECLSKSTDGVILSIGAVSFDMDGTIGETFERFVEVNSQIKAGSKVEWTTLQWWFNQEQYTRKEQVEAFRFPLKSCLEELSSWCIENLDEKFRVWSNGASFDLAMLNLAYDRHDMPTPWKYNRQMDCRTIAWLSKISTKNYSEKTDVKHSAVSDAKFQIRFVVDGYKILKDY